MIKRHYSDGIVFSITKDLVFTPLDMGYIKLHQIGENIMERGSSVFNHIQECHEISYITSGEADFFVDGEWKHLKQGDIHLVSKNSNHAIRVTGNTRLRYIFFGFDFYFENKPENQYMKELAEFYSNVPKNVIQDNGTIFTFLSHFVNELYQETQYSTEVYLSYATLLLINTYRIAKSTYKYKVAPGKTDDTMLGSTVFNIVKYIDANIVSITKVQEVSRNLNYSASYISRLFAQKMGITIREYISKKKIEKSLELIKLGSMNLSEIAYYLHYESYNSFSKKFKNYIGVTPKEYIKNIDHTQQQ